MSTGNWIRRVVYRNEYGYHKVLRESMYAISTVLDLDELLERIINTMRKCLDVERVCLYLVAEDGRCSLRRGVSTHGNAALNQPLDDAVIRGIQETGHVV